MNFKKFKEAIDLFDDANRQDPNQEMIGETEYPTELLYAVRLTEWVKKLDSNPSEVLLLAARCQHLCRWEVPRNQFPMDRAGYLKWRQTLAKFHAEEAGKILKKVGYPEETIQKVQAINLKKDLKDPDIQTIEDALCLVFLEFQFEKFIQKTPEEKVPLIIQKTWRKMSPRGRKFALKLPFSKKELDLIKKSLNLY